MTCAAAYYNNIKTLDLQHRGEGVAAVRVGLVLVVGGEAGAHDALMELEMPEMRLVGVVGFFVATRSFCKRCLF